MSEMDKDILKTDNKNKKTNKTSKTELPKTSSNYTKKRKRKRKRTTNKIENAELVKNKKGFSSPKNEETKTTAKKKNIKSSKTNKKRKSNKKRRTRRNNRKNNKTILIIFIIILIISLVVLGIIYKSNYDKKLEESINNKLQDIEKHYNEYVMTNKETDIYKLENDKYVKVGKMGSNQELTLEEITLTHQDEYLKIKTFEEEYYIYYKDIEIIENISEINQRYKKYIPYNKNIITNEETSFYDLDNNLVYKFNKSFELPIIINKEDIYGVEYNNQLLYIKKEDVKETINNNNTKLTNTSGIAVLNYHFFYDETKQSEKNDCNQIICHSKSGFKKHLEYIKKNNIFTPTMEEFEMYLNKEINLPKSVLITIDDGWRTEIGKQLLQEYELNGTIFLITSWFKEIKWLNSSKYIEYHSHGDNLHNQGECPGGQGGAIKCKDEKVLLNDLSLSREKLGGSTAFCYPFYEYNSYSISVLKEAGFTLAFAGGFKKATPNTDKYQIPRYVMYDYTTVNELASYIN